MQKFVPALSSAAAAGASGGDDDHAVLEKFYGTALEAVKGRYSPAKCIGAPKVKVEGNFDPKHVSTSYVERHNLTMRMHMRRFTRLTNAVSTKVENHAYANMMYYNFVRMHSKLRMSTAMAAGVSDRLWEIGDIVKLVEDAESALKKRESHRKRL